MTIKAWNKWMAALLALAFALVCLPALADGFAEDISVKAEPEDVYYGEKVTFEISGLESANMAYSIRWERTAQPGAAEDAQDWTALGGSGETLTVTADEENASWGYRAVLVAENGDQIVSNMITFHASEKPAEDEPAEEKPMEEQIEEPIEEKPAEEQVVEPVEEEPAEEQVEEPVEEEPAEEQGEEPTEEVPAEEQAEEPVEEEPAEEQGEEPTEEVPAEEQAEEPVEEEPAEEQGEELTEEEPEEEKPIEATEETEETEEIKETHYKTTTRISRKITRYILAAQKTEETEPSLYEEVIEGQESNPDFVLPEDRSIEVTLTWDVEEPAMGDIAHFSATLNGYEELETRLQWQISPDGEEWTDIEEANELTYDVMMVPQNYRHYWRIVVTIVIPEKQQEEIPEEKKEENQEEIPEEKKEENQEEIPEEDISEEEESEKEPEEEHVILKEIIEDTILEVIKEEIDEPEDIEVIEIVEETVEIIEVADESEVPGLETPETSEQAEKDETASDLQAEETEEQP